MGAHAEDGDHALLEPVPREALEEGRELGKRPGGEGAAHRLRRGLRPGEGPPDRGRGMPHRLPKLLLPGGGRRDGARGRCAGVRSREGLSERRNEGTRDQAGRAQGKPRTGDHRAVSEGGMEDLRLRAVVLSFHRRSRDQLQPRARAGDGALRGERRAGRRAHRAGLDPGKRCRRRDRDRSHLFEGQHDEGAVGPGLPGVVAHQQPRGLRRARPSPPSWWDSRRGTSPSGTSR